MTCTWRSRSRLGGRAGEGGVAGEPRAGAAPPLRLTLPPAASDAPPSCAAGPCLSVGSASLSCSALPDPWRAGTPHPAGARRCGAATTTAA
jgi:hypothetical protein